MPLAAAHTNTDTRSQDGPFQIADAVEHWFRQIIVPLVDLNTWVSTAENEIWKDAVICLLHAWGKSAQGTGSKAVAQAKAIAKVNQPLRLTPEEVAGAGSLPLAQRPASQDVVAPIAAQIVAELPNVCKQRQPDKAIEHCVNKYNESMNALRQQQQQQQ